MSDFIVDIDSTLDLSTAETKINNFLSKYKNEPIQIKVDIDTKSINTGNLGKQIQSSFGSAGTNAGKAYNTALQTQINTMARTQRNAFSQPLNNITKQQQSYIDWWEKSLNKQKKSFNQLDGVTASNKTLTWLKNNSKAAKDYGEALQELAKLQRTASGDELKNYTKQVNAIKTEAAALGKTGASFGAEFKRAFGRIGQFTTIYGAIQRIPEYAMKAANAVLEVDTAMTELRKVSDATDNEISNYFSKASVTAKEYGATISDVISSTADFSRLGYNLKDSAELSRVATLYKNVGDGISIDTATEDIISTLKAYNIAADQSELVIDKFNEVNYLPLCA